LIVPWLVLVRVIEPVVQGPSTEANNEQVQLPVVEALSARITIIKYH